MEEKKASVTPFRLNNLIIDRCMLINSAAKGQKTEIKSWLKNNFMVVEESSSDFS